MLPTSGGIEAQILVFRHDRSTLCSLFPYTTLFRSLELSTCVLDNTQPHTILISDTNGDESGDYVFTLQRVNSPPNPTPITYGESVTGTINPQVELDVYSFSGAVGDKLLLRMTPTSNIEAQMSV